LALQTAGPPQLYVADNGSLAGSRIRRIDLGSGVISTVAGAAGCYGFGPLAVDPAGQRLYCVHPNLATGQHEIVEHDLTTFSERLVATAPEVLAMALDAGG